MAAIPTISKADGLPVVITELGPPFRVVTFSGRDRPEAPVTVEDRQRAVQTRYPGTQQASTQVMGTEQSAIPLKGWFWDPLTEIDGGPQSRVALLRGIMQGQQSCTLQWGDVITRIGRVASCKFDFYKRSKVRYEISFAVDQANEIVAMVPLPTVGGDAALKAALEGIVQLVGVMLDATRAVKTIGSVVT